MRCRGCEYPLWDIRARRCPECGRAFAPTEFEFAPQAVRWCCPHCDQAYYGEGPRGELVPGAFACVSCGATVNADEMVIRRVDGVADDEAMPQLPWLRRAAVGRVRAWLETVGLALVRPGTMMRLVPNESGVRTALWFAVLTQVLAGALSLLPVLGLMTFATASAARAAGAQGIAAPLVGSSVVLLAFMLLGSVAAPLLWAALVHGTLLATGGTEAGLRRTLQSLLYSSGASIVNAVPCVGGYIGWIWWIVSATLAVKGAHRISGGRAAFAVLWPPLLIVVLLVGGWLSMMFLAVGAMQQATIAAKSAASAAAIATGRQIGLAVERWRADGTGPLRHPLELVVVWKLPAQLLVVPDGFSDLERATVQGESLDRIPALPEFARRELLDAALAAVPDDWIAQRLGDVVLFRRPDGVAPLDDRADAWLLAIAPQRAPTDAGASSSVIVLEVGGTAVESPAELFDAGLRAENARRAAEGLSPLPDPRTVTSEPDA